MTCSISHVAINADDLEGTREFYTRLFGWTFAEHGQGNVAGAMQYA